MPDGYTARGFALFTEFDHWLYDSERQRAEIHPELGLKPRKFSVQESSLATERKVWLGMDEDRAHLSEEEARKVRDALTEFLGEDSLEEHDAEVKLNLLLHLSEGLNLMKAGYKSNMVWGWITRTVEHELSGTRKLHDDKVRAEIFSYIDEQAKYRGYETAVQVAKENFDGE